MLPQEKDKILVIGDFFIDENWLMAKTDNYHSTDVGDAHYNSQIKGPDSFVLSVCGVANVLKVLSGGSLSKSRNTQYEILGAGTWNPKDTALMKRILCTKKDNKRFMTPYTLTNNLLEVFPNDCKKKDCFNCKLHYKLINFIHKDKSNKISTNRIYRIYEGFGSDQPKLRYRFDWQMDFDANCVDHQVLKNIPNVKAVVLVDHGKGVVTKELIEFLLINYSDARYYVRTKLKFPPWLKVFKDKKKKLRLIVVDQQLVNHMYGVRTWKRSSSLCRASLELLGNLLGLSIYEHGIEKESSFVGAENTAVLFEDNWAISGSLANQGKAKVNYLPKYSDEKMVIRVGRTSIFFNSLIYWDLIKDLNEKTIAQATEFAIRNMHLWMKKCSEAWNNERPAALSGPFEDVLSWNKPNSIKTRSGTICEDYETSWNKWNLSSTKDGVLTYKRAGSGKNILINSPQNISSGSYIRELHLWRSYGTLPKFVCPGGEKRSQINDLVSSLNIFKKIKEPSVPFNCLFIAESGWGKTYLAQCLSGYFDFDFLSYSIAQMASAKELIDTFKEISSTQKRSRKKVLVFMDEIDAKINAQTALGLLLGPIWNGNFKSDGYTNKIDPCIWIFACTKPLNNLRKLTKGRDFLSRINGPIINIDFLNNSIREEIHENHVTEKSRKEKLINHLSSKPKLRSDDKKTEIVYQVVNLLNRQFGPIAEIDLTVLDLFYNILPVNGVRSLQIFVSRFNNITKGRINKRNVPALIDNKELKEQIILLDEKEYRRKFEGSNLEKDDETVKIRLHT